MNSACSFFTNKIVKFTRKSLFTFLCIDFSPMKMVPFCTWIFSLWDSSRGSRRLRTTLVVYQKREWICMSRDVSLSCSSKHNWAKECPDGGRKAANVCKLILWDRLRWFKEDDDWRQLSGWLKTLRRKPVSGQVQLGTWWRTSDVSEMQHRA